MGKERENKLLAKELIITQVIIIKVAIKLTKGKTKDQGTPKDKAEIVEKKQPEPLS